jgi:hypothetical protein
MYIVSKYYGLWVVVTYSFSYLINEIFQKDGEPFIIFYISMTIVGILSIFFLHDSITNLLLKENYKLYYEISSSSFQIWQRKFRNLSLRRLLKLAITKEISSQIRAYVLITLLNHIVLFVVFALTVVGFIFLNN